MDKKKVYGYGINDAHYSVIEFISLKEKLPSGVYKKKLKWVCPYYAKWTSMLMRCYCEKYQEKQKSYIGCTVTEDWLLFSNFRRWMELQKWEGKQLDKDLLKSGNKVYCPKYCVFVEKIVNTFIINDPNRRGKYLTGAYKVGLNFKSSCKNPFTNKGKYLGTFKTEEEAHLAWKKVKHKHSVNLANSTLVDDYRVKEVLLNKYL